MERKVHTNCRKSVIQFDIWDHRNEWMNEWQRKQGKSAKRKWHHRQEVLSGNKEPQEKEGEKTGKDT